MSTVMEVNERHNLRPRRASAPVVDDDEADMTATSRRRTARNRTKSSSEHARLLPLQKFRLAVDSLTTDARGTVTRKAVVTALKTFDLVLTTKRFNQYAQRLIDEGIWKSVNQARFELIQSETQSRSSRGRAKKGASVEPTPERRIDHYIYTSDLASVDDVVSARLSVRNSPFAEYIARKRLDDVQMNDESDATSLEDLLPPSLQAFDYYTQSALPILTEFVQLSLCHSGEERLFSLTVFELIKALAKLKSLPPSFAEYAVNEAYGIDGSTQLEICLETMESDGLCELNKGLVIATIKSLKRWGIRPVYEQTAVEKPEGDDEDEPVEPSTNRGKQANANAKIRALKAEWAKRSEKFIDSHLDAFEPFMTRKQQTTRMRNISENATTQNGHTQSDTEDHNSAQAEAGNGAAKDENGALVDSANKIVTSTSNTGSAKSTRRQVRLPACIKATLRDYQVAGVNFLANLHDDGGAGILADEMGLGKTLQTITFLSWLRESRQMRGPHLVIVPLNVLDTWLSECKQWCPSLRIVRLHGSERERQRIFDEELQSGTFDILLTSYETIVVAETQITRRYMFQYLILDEAQKIKNESTHVAQSIRKVNCINRLLLTGTPLQNNLHELWSLLNVLYPTAFESSLPFDHAFDLTRNRIDNDILFAAQKLLEPIMIRRLKREVAPNLPSKTETQIMCQLSAYQKFMYRRMLNDAAELIDELQNEIDNNGDATVVEEKDEVDVATDDEHEGTQVRRGRGRPATVNVNGCGSMEEDFGLGDGMKLSSDKNAQKWLRLMSLMMQLRKVCNHPYLFPDAEPELPAEKHLITSSGKLMVLDKLLKKLRSDGHRVLIFSQFTMMLDIIQDYLLEDTSYQFLRLDGQTNRVQRKFDQKRFNTETTDLFIYLISTRAGGLGINLQSADTVIFIDSDWNPTVDLQAQDRCHRIGSTKPVHVYRLVMEGTVEERIVARAQKKLYLNAIVTATGRMGAVAEEMSKVEGLGAKDLLSMLTFGAARVFKPDSDGSLNEDDIDTILSRSATERTDQLPTATITADGHIQGRGLFNCLSSAEDFRQSLEEQKTESNDGKAIVPIYRFGNAQFVRSNKTFRDMTSEWSNIDTKRVRTATTVRVGSDAVLKTNLYDWNDSLGRPLEARDHGKRIEVKYKRFSSNQEHCHLCKDGGLLLLCSMCPRSYHPACLKMSEADVGRISQWSCPQHRCMTCQRNAADAGGLIFKCINCSNSFCDDHVPDTVIPQSRCAELDELHYAHSNNTYYILCDDICASEAVTFAVQIERERAEEAAKNLPTWERIPSLIRQRIKQLLKEPPMPLSSSQHIATQLSLLHPRSSLLIALHHMLYGKAAVPKNTDLLNLLSFTGANNQTHAIELYYRIEKEVSLWAPNTLITVINIFGLYTQPPATSKRVLGVRLVNPRDDATRLLQSICLFFIRPSDWFRRISWTFLIVGSEELSAFLDEYMLTEQRGRLRRAANLAKKEQRMRSQSDVVFSRSDVRVAAAQPVAVRSIAPNPLVPVVGPFQHYTYEQLSTDSATLRMFEPANDTRVSQSADAATAKESRSKSMDSAKKRRHRDNNDAPSKRSKSTSANGASSPAAIMQTSAATPNDLTSQELWHDDDGTSTSALRGNKSALNGERSAVDMSVAPSQTPLSRLASPQSSIIRAMRTAPTILRRPVVMPVRSKPKLITSPASKVAVAANTSDNRREVIVLDD